MGHHGHLHPLHRHGKGVCQICNRDFLEDDPATAIYCSRPDCVTRRKMKVTSNFGVSAEKRRKEWRARTEARTNPVLEEVKKKVAKGDSDRVATGIAPYIDVPVVPLPSSRRSEFLEHLQSVIEESFADCEEDAEPPAPPDTDPDYARRLQEEAPERKVLDTACIACQGDCCMQGRASNAFLKKETIDYIRWRRPEMTSDQILDMYVSFLPQESVGESCVYHGDKGCVLQRDIRADICNSFQCTFRTALAREYDAKPGHGAVVAGISRDHDEHPEAGAPYLRVVSMSEDGDVTVHDDIELPPLDRATK